MAISKRVDWSRCLLLTLVLAIGGCSGLDLTPVSAEVGVGNDVEQSEKNMLKTEIQTGDNNRTEYIADTVLQKEINVEEYPLWLVIAFALLFRHLA